MPAGAVDLSKNCGLFVLAPEARGMIEFKVFRRHSKSLYAKAMATTILQVPRLLERAPSASGNLRKLVRANNREELPGARRQV
jgi:hypothetical protein